MQCNAKFSVSNVFTFVSNIITLVYACKPNIHVHRCKTLVQCRDSVVRRFCLDVCPSIFRCTCMWNLHTLLDVLLSCILILTVAGSEGVGAMSHLSAPSCGS